MKKFLTLFLFAICANHDPSSYYPSHIHWLDDHYESAAFYKWFKKHHRPIKPSDYSDKSLKKHKSGTLSEHYSGRYDA
jgi:hypothetical protein